MPPLERAGDECSDVTPACGVSAGPCTPFGVKAVFGAITAAGVDVCDDGESVLCVTGTGVGKSLSGATKAGLWSWLGVGIVGDG